MEYHLEKYGEHVEEWNVVLPTKNQVKITVETLLDNCACSGQVGLFNIKFPKGVVLRSEEHAVRIAKSVANVFYFGWAGGNLLNARFCGLYEEAMAPHRKAYEEAREQHWKAYMEAIATEFAKLYWKQEVEK